MAARQKVLSIKHAGDFFLKRKGRLFGRQCIGCQPALRHLPARQQIARQHQKWHRPRIHRIGLRPSVGAKVIDAAHKVGHRAVQVHAYALRACIGLLLQFFCRGLNIRGDAAGKSAPIAQGFAPQQIVGLNRRGAFVNRQNLGIAQVLRRPCFFDKAHAAMHLHAQLRHFQHHFRAIAFDQGHQKFVQGLRRLALSGIGAVLGSVMLACGKSGQGTAALGQRPHGHQHTAHIGVGDDGYGFAASTINRTALHAFFGIGHGVLICAFGQAYALQTDAITRRVHHDEHVLQAKIFLPYQIAHRTARIAILQHAGGRGFDAQFVFDADAMHIIACAQAVIGLGDKFGHDKQANAFDASRRIRRARQHQMHDVFA